MQVKKAFLTFDYNDRGFGDLKLYDRGYCDSCLWCRTGSINRKGDLVNAIKPGVWTVRKPSVNTKEKAMVITPGRGFKIRMWTPQMVWSHYLIHLDGNMPGTKGCIGIQRRFESEGYRLRGLIDGILDKQNHIPVFINTPWNIHPAFNSVSIK